MQRNDELIIRIKSDLGIVVESIENGIISSKEISPDSLIDCIKGSIKHGFLTSGVLPPGCVSFSKGESYTKICVEYPKLYSDIQYEKTVYPNFPLPRLIFGFDLSNDGRVCSVNICVPGEGRLTPKTPLYIYPFSNVSGFRMCCGGNSLPVIKSPHQLSGVMSYIMSMPNNNDHYHTGNTKLNLEYRNLLETLKDKSPDFYYSDVLKQSGKTLNDFINDHF